MEIKLNEASSNRDRAREREGASKREPHDRNSKKKNEHYSTLPIIAETMSRAKPKLINVVSKIEHCCTNTMNPRKVENETHTHTFMR